MESDNHSRQRGNYNHHNHRNHRGGRGGRGGRGRGRGGGGGGNGGGGYSKLEHKMVQKGQFREQKVNNNYHVLNNSRNNLPASIDLKDAALVEYVGEMFFKESFLQNPWDKIEEHHNNEEM